MEAAVMNPLTGQPVDDAKLKGIADLAKRQLQLEAEDERLSDLISKNAEKLREVRETLLPMAMLEIGMSSFTLATGFEIVVAPFYQGKIPTMTDCQKDPSLAIRREAAFQWLRDHNFDSMIKREVWLTFGKGEDKKADTVKQLLIKKGFIPQDEASVHAQTLKAFIREQIEGGKTLPTDLFGVYVGNRAKVTPTK